jgi:hypothetical protein
VRDTENDLDVVFSNLVQRRAGGLVISADTFFSSQSAQLAALALRHAVPTVRLPSAAMIALFCLCLALFVSPFKSTSRLEAEYVALRHQLIILRRKVRGRIQLTHGDRLFFVQLYRWFPSVLKVITIVRPETLMRWHRAGFRRYWRWKSRSLGGRPQIDADLRALIRRMSVDNPLWGAPRIHGELLKRGFEVAQSSVAKYMVKRCGPPLPWVARLPA